MSYAVGIPWIISSIHSFYWIVRHLCSHTLFRKFWSFNNAETISCPVKGLFILTGFTSICLMGSFEKSLLKILAKSKNFFLFLFSGKI